MINGFNNPPPSTRDQLPSSSDSDVGRLNWRNSYSFLKNSALSLIERIEKFCVLFFSNRVTSQRAAIVGNSTVTLLGRVEIDRGGSSRLVEFIRSVRPAVLEMNPLLVNMKNLDLKSCRIEGLPDEFCELVNLTNLELSQNELEVLPENFGNLSRLKRLDLRDNKFQSIPTPVYKLLGLNSLLLVNNQLEFIADEIGNLSRLGELDLSNNRLPSIPSFLCNLSNIEQLWLGHNQLESLPENFGDLSKLTSLGLNSNRFQSIPNSICEFLNLQWLMLSHNQLESLPEEIGNLSELEHLDVSFNGLRSLPASIGRLSKLRRLDLDNNQLESIPECLFQLSSNCTVNLERNNLSLETVEQLRSTTRDPNYRGPRFLVSIHNRPAVHFQAQRQMSLQTLLNDWCEAGSVQLLMSRLTEKQRNDLWDWLVGLMATEDYRTQETVVKEKARSILKWLSEEKDGTNLQIAYQVLAEATSSCGDRVALSVNTLSRHIQLCQIGQLSLEELKNLIIGLKRLDRLHQMAEEKCAQMRLVDPIEVYLYYESKLKDDLELPCEVEGMLFAKVVNITDEELLRAKKDILEETTAVKQRALLLESPNWRQALEKEPTFAGVKEECDTRKQAFCNQIDFTDDEAMKLHHSTFQQNDETIWNPYYVLTSRALGISE